MEAPQLIEKNSSVMDAARKKLQKFFFFFTSRRTDNRHLFSKKKLSLSNYK